MCKRKKKSKQKKAEGRETLLLLAGLITTSALGLVRIWRVIFPFWRETQKVSRYAQCILVRSFKFVMCRHSGFIDSSCFVKK